MARLDAEEVTGSILGSSTTVMRIALTTDSLRAK
jgi:hypothetical protein